TWSRSSWSRSAAGGTSWPTTCTGTAGAASGWTGSTGATRPGPRSRPEGRPATGPRFRPGERPADEAAAFVRAGIEHAPWNHEVEALIEAPATTVRDRIGRWVTVEEVDDRRCRLRMTTDSLDWALLALGATGADFAVVGPAE